MSTSFSIPPFTDSILTSTLASFVSSNGRTTSANLPFVREKELRCACQIYGIHPPCLLDYQDGQLAIVNQGQAVGRLVRIIRELRPQVLITFGPDGIYGHYDHIAVYRWATIAAELAADPGCFPEQLEDVCQPHQVNKVYFRTLPETQIEAMAEEEGKPAAVMMDGVPFYFAARPEDEITTVIDVSQYVEPKLRGIQCHATQVGRNSRFSDTPDEVMGEHWFRHEHFALARTTLEPPREVETDLFAGLR